MYLVDTDVISEARKGQKANSGVRSFLRQAASNNLQIYLSVITVGELRQGIEAVRHRGDTIQASVLERWLKRVAGNYAESILPFDSEMAEIWARLRVPHPENPLDKQLAATALMYGLTVVTRNVAHFEQTGVRLLNPFD